MITPSAPASAASAACSGVPMPKPSATGTDVHACARASDRRERVPPAGPLPGRAGHGDRVEKAPREGADAREPIVRAGRCHERHEREARGVARLQHGGGLLERQVGHDEPARAGVDGAPRERLRPAREHDVRVAHEDDRDANGDVLAHRQHAGERRPRPQGHRARGVDDGPVGERVREGNAELDQVGAPVRVGEADLAGGVERREPAHQVRHERRAAGRLGERLGDARADLSRPPRASTSARSLSPRPERHTRSMVDPPPSSWIA